MRIRLRISCWKGIDLVGVSVFFRRGIVVDFGFCWGVGIVEFVDFVGMSF